MRLMEVRISRLSPEGMFGSLRPYSLLKATEPWKSWHLIIAANLIQSNGPSQGAVAEGPEETKRMRSSLRQRHLRRTNRGQKMISSRERSFAQSVFQMIILLHMQAEPSLRCEP